MNKSKKTPLLVILLAGFLSACAAGDLVVVLPEADGKTGSVVVRQGDQSVVLDKPFAAARSGTGGAPTKVTIDETEVRTIFQRALGARPAPPVSFILYFAEGTARLTAESQPELDKIFAEIAKRPAPEVTVIGHTDRVGKIADNDRLALRRARAVREVLIQRGIKADIIDVAGRGEREPLVQTRDEVAEPRNRRSEINVR